MVNKRKTSTGIQGEEKAKRKKSESQLSNLPMDILCSILSRLPLKEAVRTGVLSTQWKHLWCSRDTLDFSYGTVMSKSDRIRRFSVDGRRMNKERFIKRVNAILRQHYGVGMIKQFRVHYALLNEDADHIDRWVKYAIKSKAEDLILSFPTTRFRPSTVPYDFPFEIVNMKNSMHLRYLHLTFVSLRPPADVTCFSNLTKLILENVRVTDEDLQCFLSKCNSLIYLRIAYCNKLESLRTHHLNELKHLHIESCPLLKVTEVNRGVTDLWYRGAVTPLAISGSSELINICIKPTGSAYVLDSVFNKLPDNLSALKKLTLRRACFLRKLPKFISLSHLILELAIYGHSENPFDVLDIGCLLEAAPLMEKFDLHMIMRCRRRRYFEGDGELRSLPPYLHSHLRMVNITGFFGQKDQLELALHILHNAVALKAMKIVPRVEKKLEPREWHSCSPCNSADGYSVASEFICREDHNNVVEVSECVEAS